MLRSDLLGDRSSVSYLLSFDFLFEFCTSPARSSTSKFGHIYMLNSTVVTYRTGSRLPFFGHHPTADVWWRIADAPFCRHKPSLVALRVASNTQDNLLKALQALNCRWWCSWSGQKFVTECASATNRCFASERNDVEVSWEDAKHVKWSL